MDQIVLMFGGVVVSMLVELIDSKLKLNVMGNMFVVVVLSLIGGATYYALLHFGLWQAFLNVLVAAGAFYAFIIKNVKDASKPTSGEIDMTAGSEV